MRSGWVAPLVALIAHVDITQLFISRKKLLKESAKGKVEMKTDKVETTGDEVSFETTIEKVESSVEVDKKFEQSYGKMDILTQEMSSKVDENIEDELEAKFETKPTKLYAMFNCVQQWGDGIERGIQCKQASISSGRVVSMTGTVESLVCCPVLLCLCFFRVVE